MYLGSWKIDDNLTFAANTHDPDTGVATDADSAPTYRVYEDENGTAILNGSMAKLDDTNTTGFYSEQIALSAANGFEKGKCYTIYIQATVDSDTGTMHHTFQLEAEVDANSLNGTAVETAVGNKLDAAIPGSPTANSINERLKALDELLESGGGGDAAAILGDTAEIQGKLPTNKIMGSSDTADHDADFDAVTPADDSITAAKIATDAIDADALKTDAVEEIRDAIFAHKPTAGGVTTFGTIAKGLWAFIRGRIAKDSDDYEYYDDDGDLSGGTKVFENRKSASARTPQ